MAKKLGFGGNLLVGIKGFVVSIVTALILVLPAWMTRWFITMENLYYVGAIFGLVIIFFYFVIWGWLAYKFWKWS